MRNLRESADWCLSEEPRKDRILPQDPDPIYENLYDRFYAIMHDVAVLEHLSFAHALCEDDAYREAATGWLLGMSRCWGREAEEEVTVSKAYSVTRLLKGLAVGYDIEHPFMPEPARYEVRRGLVGLCGKYFSDYFSTGEMAGWTGSPHHQVVEWASFGVAALALLGEEPGAEKWVEATVRKFDDQLLPKGLAVDGAQMEGATFWASTMQYRIFFLDALRRVTGLDLFARHAGSMSPDLALASVAGPKGSGYSNPHESVIMQPGYGQLEYLSPVLLFLAREYELPTCRRLALWDQCLGALQRTRYVTPHGEELLFELGGYAYLWCEPGETPPRDKLDKRLSFHFPSVGEAYLRSSWDPGGMVVGVRADSIVVHCGGIPLLISGERSAPAIEIGGPQDDGRTAEVMLSGKGGRISVTLTRPGSLRIRREMEGELPFWCQGTPELGDDILLWKGSGEIRVLEGAISRWDPRGHGDDLRVGHGRLSLKDPAPRSYPSGALRPSGSGVLVLQARTL